MPAEKARKKNLKKPPRERNMGNGVVGNPADHAIRSEPRGDVGPGEPAINSLNKYPMLWTLWKATHRRLVRIFFVAVGRDISSSCCPTMVCEMSSVELLFRSDYNPGANHG